MDVLVVEMRIFVFTSTLALILRELDWYIRLRPLGLFLQQAIDTLTIIVECHATQRPTICHESTTIRREALFFRYSRH